MSRITNVSLVVVPPLFLLAIVILGYMYVENQKYDAYADCFERMEALNQSTQQWFSICEEIMTHKLQFPFEPSNDV